MATLKKAPRRTNDRKSVGVSVQHHRSIASAKGGARGSKTAHSGQPQNLSGKGLMTGGNGKNC
jgi:hypothetical protein